MQTRARIRSRSMARQAQVPGGADPFDDPSIKSAVMGGDVDDLESNPFETTSLKRVRVCVF